MKHALDFDPLHRYKTVWTINVAHGFDIGRNFIHTYYYFNPACLCGMADEDS